MKYLSITLAILLLAGCSIFKPKKEYEYVLDSGLLATPEQVAETKASCEYDKKMQQAKDNLGIAISIGRYESGYGPKKSDEYTNKASQLILEASVCMKTNGLSKREKIKA